LILEGRTNSFALEIEKKFRESLEKFKGDQMEYEQTQRIEKKKYEADVED
jgi:hypothetical protein